MKVAMGKQSITIPITRTVLEEGGANGRTWKSWRPVPDGTLTGTVELRIDVAAILQAVGRRALHTKGKRSVALGGAVEVVVLRHTLKRETPTDA